MQTTTDYTSVPLTEPATLAAQPPSLNTSDGVFANITAKPDSALPPAYTDNEQIPTYFEATIQSSSDDVIIDNMEVGHPISFILSCLISMSFDFIGFLMTSLLSTNHASRCGSRMGLGVTLIRYGAFIDSDRTENSDWVSSLLLFVGFFVVVQSNAEFFRYNRMRSVILMGGAATVV